MAENDISQLICKDCSEVLSFMRPEIMRPSGPCSYSLQSPLAPGRVETVFADQAYQGLEETFDKKLDWTLEVVESDDDESGFSVDPKRWIAERTYGWFGGWRRLDREYERRTDSSETMVRFAMLRIVLNRLD